MMYLVGEQKIFTQYLIFYESLASYHKAYKLYEKAQEEMDENEYETFAFDQTREFGDTQVSMMPKYEPTFVETKDQDLKELQQKNPQVVISTPESENISPDFYKHVCFNSFAPKSDEEKKNSDECQIWIPKAICIVSIHPFYEFFSKILLDLWFTLFVDPEWCSRLREQARDPQQAIMLHKEQLFTIE